MSDLKKLQEFVKWFNEIIFGTEIKEAVKVKPKRARGKKGRYLADNPKTKDVNEAWIGGKAPKKKRKK